MSVEADIPVAAMSVEGDIPVAAMSVEGDIPVAAIVTGVYTSSAFSRI